MVWVWVAALQVAIMPLARPSTKKRKAKTANPLLHGWKPVATAPTTMAIDSQRLMKRFQRWLRAPPDNEPNRKPTLRATKAREISSKLASILSLKNVNVGAEISENSPWNKEVGFLPDTLICVLLIRREWRESFSGIPGACATRNFTYLARGP